MEKIDLKGSHMMLDCSECDKRALASEEKILEFLERIPKELGFRKISEPKIVVYKGRGWDKGGITGFVLIAESHVSIHTYPHDDFFTADIYSCKPFDTEKAIRIFREYFKQKKENIKIVKRELQVLRENSKKKLAI